MIDDGPMRGLVVRARERRSSVWASPLCDCLARYKRSWIPPFKAKALKVYCATHDPLQGKEGVTE